MTRADQRRTSIDAAFCDIEAAELLDRTGIIAASLPKRRRSPENAYEPEPVQNPVCEPVVDQDLRPKAVVIHRRAKSWLVGGAGAALLAIGWFAGSLTTPSTAVEGIAEPPRSAVANQPIAPQAPAAQAVPQPAPVTVYVPVTVKQQAPAPKQRKPVPDEEVLALPAETRPPEQPRVDSDSLRPSTRSPEDLAEDFRQLTEPAAQSMAERMTQEMLGYNGGR
jgi:hypothetical protein